jgi:hypothetical protein
MSGRITAMPIDYSTALNALDQAYGGLTELATGLERRDLLRPTRCFGWLLVDVLFHVLCDAQRALVALANPVPGPADRDLATYWTGFPEPGDPMVGIWWTRRSAAAFRDGTGVVRLWMETAPAVVRAAGRAEPSGYVATQGHVLAVPDLLVTLVTEAVIHHLDMAVDLPGVCAPGGAAAAGAAVTLDAILGGVRPPWPVEEYLLKGSGRLALTDQDGAVLGSAAARFPLLG